MSRFALVIWLSTPLLIIGALAMMMDRSLGKPDVRAAAIAASRLPGQAADSSRDQASIDRELAETAALRNAGAAAQPDAGTGPRMVQPESLEQGFIILVEDKSKHSSNESPIFMASSHNGWNPSDQAMKLTRRSDMRWQIVMPKPTLDSRIAFKFTRGSWDLVEVRPDFENIENRLLPMVDASKLGPGETPVIELVVEAWRDQSPQEPARLALNPYRPITVGAGTLKRLEVVGGGGFVKNRDVLVWMPPGYDDPANAKVAYPVLYMADGQNIFEKLPGLPAEWGADETAARLIAEEKIQPIIIVGIPHAGAGRAAEYSPIALIDGVAPRGGEWVDWVVGQVKPRVDRAFRTAQGPENTAIGGASLGGMIALEAGTRHPEIFGKVLVESTPLAMRNRAAFTHFAGAKAWPARIYFGMGGKEAGTAAEDETNNALYASSAQAFAELLRGKGFSGDTLMVKVDPAAVHNEEAWAKRLPAALEFLFPAK